MRTPRFPCFAAARACQACFAASRPGVVAGLSTLALLVPVGAPTLAGPASDLQPAVMALSRSADLGGTAVPDRVRRIADWSAARQDHAARPFVIVDKPGAQLYLFDGVARLQAHTPVLIGSARGDLTAPGLGLKAIADVLPAERTTPAGRFNGELGHNLTGEEVVWVDYEAAVSMHRVRLHKPAERRAERLASASLDDNRISYGCVNVPAAFFEARLLPVFATRSAVIYVLPDQLSLEQVFGPLS